MRIGQVCGMMWGSVGSDLLCQPMVNETAGDAQLLRQLRQMVAVVESTGTQLVVLQLDGAPRIVGRETHHQSAGVGPGLAVEVAYVADAEASLFAYFAFHALLQCLARLEESRHQAVERAAEIARMYQQHLVRTTADKHDDGCRDGGIDFVAARRATFHDGRPLFGACTADRTEAAVTVPPQYLESLARSLVFSQAHVVERGPQPCHGPPAVLVHRTVGCRRAYHVSVGQQHFVVGRQLRPPLRQFRFVGHMAMSLFVLLQKQAVVVEDEIQHGNSGAAIFLPESSVPGAGAFLLRSQY